MIALEVFEIDPVWMTVIVTNDIIIMALLGRTNTKTHCLVLLITRKVLLRWMTLCRRKLKDAFCDEFHQMHISEIELEPFLSS